MADRSGQRMGIYLLLKLVGQDKLGELYHAVHVETQEEKLVQAPPLGTRLYTHSTLQEVKSLQWSLDGIFMATAELPFRGKGSLYVWSPFDLPKSNGKMITAGKNIFAHHEYGLRAGIAWSPTNDMHLATGYGGDQKRGQGVRIWDLSTGRTVADLTGIKKARQVVTSIAWSQDGKCMVAGASPLIGVWDVATGQCIQVYEEHEPGWTGLSAAVALSPDGTRVASVAGKSVRVWEARTGKTLAVIADPKWESVDWSPDGTRIVSCGPDSAIIISDAKTGRQILACNKHGDLVLRVAWSPDGSRIAAAHNHQTISLWDAETGKQLFQYEGHRGFMKGGNIKEIAWCPDGVKLASADSGKHVQIWQAA